MLLLHHRTLPDNQTLPVDQRWRTLELDSSFNDLDLSTPQGIGAAIKRINEGQVSNVEPFPYGSMIYLTDTDKQDHWSLKLSVTKE